MILRRLHLHPFAGTADRDQTFSPGLNVILGPNEAGKTTLRNALWKALFLSTHLTKRKREESVLPYLPLGGGDTVRVSVDLETGDGSWKLHKEWTRSGGASELVLPDGGVITDADEVEGQVATLLVCNPGTWRNVLFSSQGTTARALDTIVGGSAVDDLRDTLRRSGFETDGVSIETLAENIEQQWKDAFGRWDRELDRPEGNRGIENPWSRGAGSIVAAYYQQQEAQKALEEAESYYLRLDDATKELNTAAAGMESLKTWVRDHGAAAKDADQRVPLEAKLELAQSQEDALKKASQEWPVAVARAHELEKQAGELSKAAQALAEEQRQAEAWEAAGEKRMILGQAQDLSSRISEARKTLEDVPEVSADDVETLEQLKQEGDQIRTRLEASELSLTFTAKQALDMDTQAGVEDEEHHSLSAGDVLEFTAGSRASLRHPHWSLDVQSGDIDVAAEEARFREVQTSLEELLKTMGAEDLATAREMLTNHQQKTRDLAALQDRLQELLGEQTLEALEKEIETAGGGETPPRAASAVAEERTRRETAALTATQDAAEEGKRIQEWEEAYGSQDGLLDQLVELRGARKEVETKVESLLPLPEGFDDAQTFLDQFKAKDEALNEAKDRYNELLREKEKLEVQAPEIEPAEAQEARQEAQAGFERALQHGEAVDRIRTEFEHLRAEMDEGTLQPWLEHLSETMAPLSGDRYTGLDPDGKTFSLGDQDIDVPFPALSMGTRASLALAVRLSMARWFLQDRRGFLVLDDPLVDLDPERQQQAAAMLRRFAEDKQVLLMTCHPSHADVLGGEVIEV